jgi:hypothetical protein
MPEKTRQNIDQAFAAYQTAAWKFGTFWCDSMHDAPMWPIHGEYECRICGRRYPVPWAGDTLLPAPAKLIAAEPARIRRAGVPSFRSASLLLIITLIFLLASPVQAADEPIVDSNGRAAMAFARYIVGLEQETAWSLETVEIDASLPKLEKQGRLRAIRRLLPLGRPEYQVLEIEGDQTVRQQVIVRYLSAQVQAAAIPASSVAINLANYKFRYKGAVDTGETVAYAFLITPRKKREGLINGVLWLDGETGAVVRQSGYLVKKPSIFVKRVDVTRETAFRDGIAEMRVTHLSVDTRLVGRAQLIIHERPYATPDSGAALSIAGR